MGAKKSRVLNVKNIITSNLRFNMESDTEFDTIYNGFNVNTGFTTDTISNIKSSNQKNICGKLQQRKDVRQIK